jgi:hypothetical protein
MAGKQRCLGLCEQRPPAGRVDPLEQRWCSACGGEAGSSLDQIVFCPVIDGLQLNIGDLYMDNSPSIRL